MKKREIGKRRTSCPKPIKETMWRKYFKDKMSGNCFVCEKPINFTDFEVGHDQPFAKGGEWNIENVRPICRSCNRSMGTMTIEEFKSKYFSRGLHPNQFDNGKLIEESNNLKLTFEKFNVNILFNKIQNIDYSDKYTAVVLPANDCFDDECVYDETSSLGAFFLNNFEKTEIEQIWGNGGIIYKHLREKDSLKINGLKTYPIGTTIYLSNPFNYNLRAIIVGVTTKRKGKGITSNLTDISLSVKEAMRTAADNKINSLFMPLIGTGHGDVDENLAILTLLNEIIYNFKRRFFHSIKDFNLVVYDPECEKKDEIKSLLENYRSILFGGV